MNTIYKYIHIFLIGLFSWACAQIEEQPSESEDNLELVDLTFVASIEDDFTKTILDGQVGDGTHHVLWCPEDKIDIVPILETSFLEYTFNNTSEEYSRTVMFEGKAVKAENYFAFYPAGMIGPFEQNYEKVRIRHFSPITYQEGSISHNSFPMVARFQQGDDISFNNLCGVFALRLTGSQTVKSITFESDPAYKVSGDFFINMEDETLELTPVDGASSSSMTIDCGEEGVTLKEDEATLFYFVLPPRTYETFSLCILTKDEGTMLKQASKPLEIKRSFLTPSGALGYVETLAIDLSENGTANCYVVSEPNFYSFDVSVMGNGADGIIADAGYHTSDASLEPKSFDLLWSEPAGVISNLNYTLEQKRVSFTSSGLEGNAVIAARNEQGEIIWSWQIWATDEPQEQYYKNSVGEFHVLDRNMGAIRADKGEGEQWKESVGTLYQWGRKDPNTFSICTQYGVSYFESITESIKYPSHITNGQTWLSPMNTTLWSQSQKTIYDPCPVGYRVANSDMFADITATGTMDLGWNVDYGEGATGWYPVTPYIGYGRVFNEYNVTIGYIWSADECSSVYAQSLTYSSAGISLTKNRSVADLYPVRCMKDEDYFTLEVPVLGTVQVHDVKVDSAVISFDIRHEGASEVTECGIIYGVTSGDLLENGTKVPASGDACQVQLIGLAEGTKYYAMAYATNAHGTSYSKEKSFQTRHLNGVDLSENGTSNCYMISSPDSYFFDASVKGNSNESVGSPVEVEVLWETKNTTAEVSVGDIVNNVILTDGTIYFEATGAPGNALIAVKDATGTIIWSWHIWVSDYDPDENYCTYLSGAVMMDRNLGALNCGYDPESFGLLYQWGRKDPLLGSADGSQTFATTAPVVNKQQFNVSNPVEYTFANPIHRVDDLNNDASAWGRTKTMYDPCPPGWRVPDGGSDGVWNGMIYGSPGIESFYDSSSALVYWVINPPYSTPATTYPAPGYTDESSGVSLMFPGSALYCWSCDYANEIRAYAMHLFDRIERELKAGKEDEFSVRCMKE